MNTGNRNPLKTVLFNPAEPDEEAEPRRRKAEHDDAADENHRRQGVK